MRYIQIDYYSVLRLLGLLLSTEKKRVEKNYRTNKRWFDE